MRRSVPAFESPRTRCLGIQDVRARPAPAQQPLDRWQQDPPIHEIRGEGIAELGSVIRREPTRTMGSSPPGNARGA